MTLKTPILKAPPQDPDLKIHVINLSLGEMFCNFDKEPYRRMVQKM